jgi:hypothetical protein
MLLLSAHGAPKRLSHMGVCPAAVRSADGRLLRSPFVISRETGQTAPSRNDDAADRQLVQQGFTPTAPGRPNYMKPVRYDARKLQDLLGTPQMTSYDTGIGQTAWIASHR